MSQSRPSDCRRDNNLEANQLANITNEFEEIKAGRRLSLEFPVSRSVFQCNFISIVVLDSPRVADEISTACCACAALIVPQRREKDWVYTSEGGQWQLLASAGVSRFIILFPKRDPLQHEGFESRLGKSAAQAREDEDEQLKTILRPLVLALCPKVLFDRGIPDIPFIKYTDNVARRVEIEVAYSPLTGLIMVEDVELKPECEEDDESSSVSEVSEHSLGLEQEPSGLQTPSTKKSNTWKRRLVFQRMPNLIQTEVPLISSKDVDRRDRKDHRFNSRRTRGFQEAETGVKRVVDHSRLVHKYLPPIVAGFVLITPCLDVFFGYQHGAKVVCIGVGGGALPTFLHNQFGFHIKVIDLDEVVLELARRHFGLKEGPNFEVTTGDGLDAVALIAGKAISAGFVRPELRVKWESSGSTDLQPCDSATQVAYEQEMNLLTGRKLSWTARDWKSECEMLTDSDCGSESGFLDDVARDATTVNDVTTTSRSSELERRDSQSTTLWQRGKMDPRVEMIIVDVDVSDARAESSAPPVAFLEHKFLLSAQVALKEGGMLVMNVISSGKKAYDDVVQALAVTFEEIYEIPVENHQIYHCVVFALPKPAFSPTLAGPTVELVQRHVDGQFINQIRSLKSKSTGALTGSLIAKDRIQPDKPHPLNP